MSNFAADLLPPSAFSVSYQQSPQQMRRRKIVKKGFSLCLMVCGRSGTGKSTFINTLCNGAVFREHRPRPTTEMQLHDKQVQLDEDDGTTIHLTVVDTPGFGDAIDNNHCCDKIVKYLESQYDEILAEEQRVKRNPRFKDNRVHAALYFITPTGHGLRELDIDLMMSLSARVNVIPVIAKADTLTSEELVVNKQAIMNDIKHFGIPIYFFPVGDFDDEETVIECDSLRKMVPFAIVGSNQFHEIEFGPHDWRYTRARQYPWGTVSVDDPSQSEFLTLRSVLFGSHLQELRDLTHEVLYEKYRTEKLSDGDPNILAGAAITPQHDSADTTEVASTMPGVTQTLYKEQQQLQKIEEDYQREIEEKRAELLLREKELKEITAKLHINTNSGSQRRNSDPHMRPRSAGSIVSIC